MTIQKTINLIMKSSGNNPYGGNLPEKDHLISAIDLAETFLEFARKGQTDEAMDLPVEHWEEVLDKLKTK